VIEAAQIGVRQSDRLTAGKSSPGNFGLLQHNRHIPAQSQCGSMSAASESGLCIVIATCCQRIAARDDMLVETLWPVALALLLGRRGRRTYGF
jgi:hypothetical protein